MPHIRPETFSDINAIRQLTAQAFSGQPHSHQTEHLLIDALRAANALSVSLVAEQDGELLGHIAFSRVWIDDLDCHWFGLAPLAVLPQCQRQGIGTALIGAGLSHLDALGALGCVVLGDPAYYRRFGFHPQAGLTLEGVPAEYFMAHAATAACPQGRVSFHPAFALCD